MDKQNEQASGTKGGCGCHPQSAKEEPQASQAKSADAESGGPMAMGMGMAKKMMAQMGQGGGPMEMMQKMMAQMSHGEGKPPMEKMMGMCMGMCAEMLTGLRQTNALAVFATPELQHAFGEWLKDLESKAEAAVAQGEKDAAALASALNITEDSARYVLARLAASGKVMLVARSPTQGASDAAG
ncbi:MAG: hypothetical protein M0006_17350 [Magnetospirillum sp.]|nr:hypothetical protein [Magnetospirillum sp.]